MPDLSAYPLLSLAIWTPIMAGLLILLVGRDSHPGLSRVLSLIGAVLGLVVTLPLYTQFDAQSSVMQFVELSPWIPRFNINYHLGVDGISMPFIILNSLITLIVVLAGWQAIQFKVAQYNAAFLIMSGLFNGIFCALDGILFYVFFEASLIPMYLIIGVWGGHNRVYAAIKFFLYTLLGSLLFLIAQLYLFTHSDNSFSILDWQQMPIPMDAQIGVFLAFLVAFAVKVPMWPLHTWLPDAHPEAPTGGSIVLAAIALKLGAYGFLRFSLPIVPDAAHELSGLMITLSLIAVVYIGFVALVQADMKRLVAYSSVAHMGFVTLGFFLFTPLAVEGAIVQMISHAFVGGAMFYCIGVIYDRIHTHAIADCGGIVYKMPVYAAFMMLFAMANAGLPATSGFVGEFMVILGALQVNFWVAAIAATTLIVSAAYALWMYKRVIFGQITNERVAGLTDINKRELLILLILAFCVLAIGVWPEPVTHIMHTSVNDLLHHVATSKLP